MLKQGAAKYKTHVQILCMINPLQISSDITHAPRATLCYSTDLILFMQARPEEIFKAPNMSTFSSKKSTDPYEN